MYDFLAGVRDSTNNKTTASCDVVPWNKLILYTIIEIMPTCLNGSVVALWKGYDSSR